MEFDRAYDIEDEYWILLSVKWLCPLNQIPRKCSSEACGKLHIHKHLLDNFYYTQQGPKKYKLHQCYF